MMIEFFVVIYFSIEDVMSHKIEKKTSKLKELFKSLDFVWNKEEKVFVVDPIYLKKYK